MAEPVCGRGKDPERRKVPDKSGLAVPEGLGKGPLTRTGQAPRPSEPPPWL